MPLENPDAKLTQFAVLGPGLRPVMFGGGPACGGGCSWLTVLPFGRLAIDSGTRDPGAA